MKTTTLLLPILSALLVSACASTDTAETPVELTSIDAEVRIEREWSTSIGSKAGKHIGIQTLPYFDQGTIYTAAANGQLSQFDETTGKLLWKKKTSDVISAGINGNDDKLFYGTKNGDLVAVNKSDAKELWRVALKSEILVNPLPIFGLVITRTLDGNIQAFASNSGEKRWAYKMSVPALNLYGNSQPIIIDSQVLIVGSDNGRLVGLDPGNGRILFESAFATNAGESNAIKSLADIDMTPSYDGQLLYISAYQNGFAAIDLKNGGEIWRHEESTYHSASFDERNVYFSDTNSQVWALNRLNGEVVWVQKKLRARKVSAPLLHKNKVIVSDYEGVLHVLSTSDGRFVSRKSTGKPGYLTAALNSDDIFYYTNKNGQFAAYKIVSKKTDPK